jgi:hypothetical protein
MKWYKRRSSGEQALKLMIRFAHEGSRPSHDSKWVALLCGNNEGRNNKCSFMKIPTNAKFDEDSRSSWWSKECRVSSWIGRTFSFDFLFRMDAAVAIVYGRIPPVSADYPGDKPIKA